MVLPRSPAAAPGIGSFITPTPCIPLSHPVQELGGHRGGMQPILGHTGTLGSLVASTGSGHDPPNPHLLQGKKLPGVGGCLHPCGC